MQNSISYFPALTMTKLVYVSHIVKIDACFWVSCVYTNVVSNGEKTNDTKINRPTKIEKSN